MPSLPTCTSAEECANPYCISLSFCCRYICPWFLWMAVLFGWEAAEYALICFRQNSITVALPDEGSELKSYPSRNFRHVDRQQVKMWKRNKNQCPCPFPLLLV